MDVHCTTCGEPWDVTNIALEEALKGNVLYSYRSENEEPAAAPDATASEDDDEE